MSRAAICVALASPRCSPAASARSASSSRRARPHRPPIATRAAAMCRRAAQPPIQPAGHGRRRKPRTYEENAYRGDPGQAAVPLVQLQRLPCQRRRRHGPGADGRQVDLRQRPGRHLRDHHAGPAERHAVVRRPHSRRPGLADRRLRALDERPAAQGRGAEPRRQHRRQRAGERARPRDAGAARRHLREQAHEAHVASPCSRARRVARARTCRGAAVAAERRAIAAPCTGPHDVLAPAGAQAAHIGQLWTCSSRSARPSLRSRCSSRSRSRCWRTPRAAADTPPDLSSLDRHERGRIAASSRAVAISIAAAARAARRERLHRPRARAHAARGRAAHRGHRPPVVVGGALRRATEPSRIVHHRQRDARAGRPPGDRHAHGRRRDPQPLGAEPRRQEGPDPGPHRDDAVPRRPCRASIAASAPSSAASSTRTWRFRCVAEPPDRLRGMGGTRSAAGAATPTDATARSAASRSSWAAPA